jgi:hypothetical protein
MPKPLDAEILDTRKRLPRHSRTRLRNLSGSSAKLTIDRGGRHRFLLVLI